MNETSVAGQVTAAGLSALEMLILWGPVPVHPRRRLGHRGAATSDLAVARLLGVTQVGAVIAAPARDDVGVGSRVLIQCGGGRGLCTVTATSDRPREGDPRRGDRAYIVKFEKLSRASREYLGEQVLRRWLAELTSTEGTSTDPASSGPSPAAASGPPAMDLRP